MKIAVHTLSESGARKPAAASVHATSSSGDVHSLAGDEGQTTAKGSCGTAANVRHRYSAVQGVSTGPQILQGSSSAGGSADARVENAGVQISSVGGAGAPQKSVTTKVCRRCGVKGHLMCECTTPVYCVICKSSDHAMSRCPILKQPKPVAQLVGQAEDALAGFHIQHAPIQPTKRDSRMALISTSGKDLNEEDVATFLRVLVSDTFAWEVKRHSM